MFHRYCETTTRQLRYEEPHPITTFRSIEMVREPNITKYFLIIVNSLLPLPWDPGLLSNNPPLVFDAVIYYLLYLALFSHLQERTGLYLYEILPWAIVLLQLVNKPFFSSKPPLTLGLNREFMIINILPYQ